MMKRFLAFTISVAVLVSVMSVFAGCDNDSSSKSTSAATTTTALTTTTTQNVTTTTQEITSHDSTLHTTAVVDKTTTDNTTTTTGKKTTTTTKRSTTSTTANSTTTSKYLQVIVGDSAWEQVMMYQVLELSDSYSGVYDWFVYGDYIHMITYSYNRYLVLDMNTGKLVRKVALPDVPRAIRRVGDEILISFDALKTIKVYDFNTAQFKRDIVLEHCVRNFEVYGDCLFYYDYKDTWRLYRYNIKTGVLDSTAYFDTHGTNTVLAVNPAQKLIYVAGKGTTGCDLYAVDMNTLEVKAKYAKSVGTSGGVYYSDGAVYWAGKKLNPTTLELLLEYQRIEDKSSWYDTVYAANGFVISDGGLYDVDSAVRLCKFPRAAGKILDDGRIIGVRSAVDENVEFHIGFNIFA